MRVFLSLPITSNLGDDGHFLPAERTFFQGVIDALHENGIEVLSAAINEHWGTRKLSVVEFTAYDVEAIQTSHALLVVTRTRLTRDIMLEIGFALGLGKSVVVALPRDAWTTHMLDGLSELSDLSIFRFSPDIDGAALGSELASRLNEGAACRD